MISFIAWSFGIGSGALNYIGRSPLLMIEQGSTHPCLGMVCADTDNPVYSIEINEINLRLQAFARTVTLIIPRVRLHSARCIYRFALSFCSPAFDE